MANNKRSGKRLLSPDALLNILEDLEAAKKRAEQSEARYRDLFENANDIIQSVDADGRFLYVNRKWKQTLGYTDAELKKLTFQDIIRQDHLSRCMQLFRELGKGKSFSGVETVFLTKNGAEVIVEGNINAHFENGRFAASRGIFRNITERRKIEEQLRKSNELYKTLVETAEAVTMTDINGRLLYASPHALKLHGFRHIDEMKKKSAFSLIAPKDRAMALKNMKQTLRKGAARNMRYTLLKKSGARFLAELNVSVISNAEGKPAALITTIRDITEREEAVRMLNVSEGRNRAILDAIPDIMFRLDSRGVFLDVKTHKTAELFVSASKIRGHAIRSLLPPKIAGTALQCIHAAIRTERMQTFTYRLRVRNTMKDYEARIVKSGRNEVLAIVRDITGRMRAEENLRKVNELNETIIEKAPFGIHVVGRDFGVQIWNAYFERYSGIRKKEIIGKNLFSVIPGLSEWKKIYRRVIATGRPYSKEEYKYIRSQGALKGKTVYQSCTIIPLTKSGRVYGVLTMLEDVTERKNAEGMMRQSEKKYRSIFEHSPEAIVILDRKGNVMDVNNRAREWLGYDIKEIVGKNILMLPFFSRKNKLTIMKKFSQRMLGKTPHPYELEFITKRGKTFTGLVSATPIKDERGNIVKDLVMISNITAMKKK